LSWATLRHDTQGAGYVLLKWTVEGEAIREKRFFKPIAIGREPNNDIELPDQRVSRHHAVIWAEQGVWRIRDLDSANGTFIDHARVNGVSALPQTCELRFHANGPTVAVFVARSAETLIS
jgi:pSer/pThr/pTyr-binding forkhead associated (FHA) protein